MFRIYKRVYVIEYNVSLSNEMVKSSSTTFWWIWLWCCVNVQWMEIKICIRYPQILLLVVCAHLRVCVVEMELVLW